MTRTFLTLGMAVGLLAIAACSRGETVSVDTTDTPAAPDITAVEDAVVASELAGGEDAEVKSEVVADEDATVAPETAAPEVAATDAGGVVAPN